MNKFNETKAQIINLVNKQIVPGASFGFISGTDQEVLNFGDRSWQPEKIALKGNELHDLASLTKVMGTIPLIIKLLNDGKISLDDPVCKYLPDFKDPRVKIFHLITHTSGITGYIPHRDDLNCQELIDALLRLPVGENFDKKVVYTDTGMIFLGLIIEKFYDSPVQKVIENEILKPWGLNDSTFSPDKTKCVPTYRVDDQLLQGVPNDPKARQLGEHCGSAGMFSTLNDVMKFARIMLGEEYAFLYKNFTKLNPGRSLGWDVKPDGNGRVLYHTGYTGHFVALDYKTQNAMVVLTNRVHPIEDNEIFLSRRDNILDAFLNEDK